jgi:carbamoylphosphate synthase large subunit
MSCHDAITTISEHVENAGIHSGDATVVLPAQRLYVQTMRQIRAATSRIATALDITGRSTSSSWPSTTG